MRRLSVVLISALMFTLALGEITSTFGDTAAVKAACTPEKSATIKTIKQRGYLRWATGIASPYGFKNTSGLYIGTEPDNARELARILGVKVEIHDYTYDLLPTTVNTGTADIVGAAL